MFSGMSSPHLSFRFLRTIGLTETEASTAGLTVVGLPLAASDEQLRAEVQAEFSLLQ
jgi:hypothetical protein